MIRKRTIGLISSLFSFTGGMIWILKGGEISLMPTGNPEMGYYRSSHSIMPWLGFGLACIGIGLIGLNLLLTQKKRFTHFSSVAALIGSFLYFYGTITRSSMDLSNEFEPSQPIGFILAIIGLLLFSISMFRSTILPFYCRMLLLISALSLLLFNDQYITSWSSIPFGVSWLGLSFYLFFNVDRGPINGG